jgi:DNA-directed RNA polymerase subunit RPC12/RpoP
MVRKEHIANMKEKLRQFMYGRYGVDELTRFILMFDCFLMVISFLIRSDILNITCILIIVLCYLRMFSKNHSKRYAENQIYLKYRNHFFVKTSRFKYDFNQRKIYHIYKCPNCKQKIRIPRGKGKISISCPHCKTEFIKHS